MFNSICFTIMALVCLIGSIVLGNGGTAYMSSFGIISTFILLIGSIIFIFLALMNFIPKERRTKT